MQLYVAGSPGSAHQFAEGTANVHSQERADRTWHISPHPAFQELHGGHDKQIAAASSSAAPPAGQCGLLNPRPQVQLWAHPFLGSRLSVSEQMEPAPQVQAQWKSPWAGSKAEQSDPADRLGQFAAVSFHPGVAGALRFLQLYWSDPQGAWKFGRTPLVPLRPFIPAALQRAEPRAAWTIGSWLQTHFKIHELLHVAAPGCSRQECCFFLRVGAGCSHCTDCLWWGRSYSAAHSDCYHCAGCSYHYNQVSCCHFFLVMDVKCAESLPDIELGKRDSKSLGIYIIYTE